MRQPTMPRTVDAARGAQHIATAGWRSLCFARSILARYRQYSERIPAVDFVWRLLPRIVVRNSWYSVANRVWNPWTLYLFAERNGGTSAGRSGELAEMIGGPSREGLSLNAMTVYDPQYATEELRRMTMQIARIMVRSERVEARTALTLADRVTERLAGKEAGDDQSVAPISLLPLSMVLRSSPAPANTPSPEVKPSTLVSAAVTSMAELPQSMKPKPLDLGRLTDQVIEAIDRRIVAHRERLGRA